MLILLSEDAGRKKGKRLGTVQVSLDGQLKAEVAAIAVEEVSQASLFWRLLVRLWHYLKGRYERLLGNLERA